MALSDVNKLMISTAPTGQDMPAQFYTDVACQSSLLAPFVALFFNRSLATGHCFTS